MVGCPPLNMADVDLARGWYAGRFRLISKRSTRFDQRSMTRGLSPTRERHAAVSCFSKTKKGEALSWSLFAEGSRQGHFFGFAFFTADFLAAFFALLFPLPMSTLAAR
jgi:hypothetical protein